MPETSDDKKLEELHERVEAMLDMPLPAVADASLPLDNSTANIPPPHLAEKSAAA